MAGALVCGDCQRSARSQPRLVRRQPSGAAAATAAVGGDSDSCGGVQAVSEQQMKQSPMILKSASFVVSREGLAQLDATTGPVERIPVYEGSSAAIRAVMLQQRNN